MPNLFDSNTNKQGLIVYGGESSSSYGMVVAEAPAYERPKRKQTIYNVPGRSGSVIFQEDAWEDVNRSYKVWLAEDGNDTLVEKVDAFEAWLNSQKGYVRLEDNFEPDVYRLAYYSGGDGFSNNLTQYGEATLNFTCRAERFLKSGETPVPFSVSSTRISINNTTKYTSKPIFTFNLQSSTSGTFFPKFRIGDLTIDLTYRGSTSVRTFKVDSEKMSFYETSGVYNSLLNDRISGTFPTISPGQNYIYFTILEGSASDFVSASYTPRYFTI